MKARKISNPYKKGNEYARKKSVRFFLSLMMLLAIVFVVGMFMDPDSFLCISGFGGTSLATMMIIGDVGDVSDRQTHGSNIAYKVYLIELSQINPDVKFPKKNANREVGTIPMKAGEYMKYFEAHDIPTYTATGEKGDITTSGENNFVIIMGGMRDQLLNFIEEHAGGKFIVLFKEVGEEQWYIIGEYDRPMILQSFEAMIKMGVMSPLPSSVPLLINIVNIPVPSFVLRQQNIRLQPLHLPSSQKATDMKSRMALPPPMPFPQCPELQQMTKVVI